MSDMPKYAFVRNQMDITTASLVASYTDFCGATKYIRADLVPAPTPDAEPPLSVRDHVALSILNGALLDKRFSPPEDFRFVWDLAVKFLAARKDGRL